MTERDVVVSHHAVRAYRSRRNDRRSFRALEREIQECVRESLEQGRVFNHKPDGFVLFGRRRNQLPPGQRFVQCSDDHGFVLKRLPAGDDVVVTCLTRVGVRR